MPHLVSIQIGLPKRLQAEGEQDPRSRAWVFGDIKRNG